MQSKDFIDSSENISLVENRPKESVSEHTHEFIEIVYIANGSGIHTINKVPYVVVRGDVLVFNIGDKHAVTPDGDMRVINILLNPAFVSNELVNSHDAIDLLAFTSFREFEDTDNNFPPKIRLQGKDVLEVETILTAMKEEFAAKSIGYKTILKGYLNVLMAKTFRVIYQENALDVRRNLDTLFPEILDYIEENYHRKITLAELARNGFYNPSYFGQVFRECFGMTPIEYVNHKRILEACRILAEDQCSIEQVCYLVGYRDKTQFYKVFKQYTGQTPGQYRKSL